MKRITDNRAAAPVNREQTMNQPSVQRPAVQNRDNQLVTNNRAYEESLKEKKTK